VSTAIEKVLAVGDSANWAKVEVKDAGSNWIELNDLMDRDWVRSVKMTRSADAATAAAVVECHLREDGYNLSPLFTGGKINATNQLIAAWNQIRISTATVPVGVTPASGDYNKVFQGRIVRPAVSDAQTLNLACQDDGIVLARSFVKRVTQYAAAAPETMIQSILTDWGGGVTLRSAATGATYTTRDVPRESVLETCRKLAHAIGWDLRYKWWSATADIELVMSEPDRDLSGYGGGATDRTYTQAQWKSISVDIETADIRNEIWCAYNNAAKGSVRTARSTDNIGALAADIATSQGKYGTIWCELSEDATSRLDSAAEVDTFLTAAFYDLWEPTATVTLRVPYLFAHELNDVIGLTADDVHFDSNQRLALYAIEDTITQGGMAESTLTLRGTPTIGAKTWLRKQVKYDDSKVGLRNLTYKARSGNLCDNYNFEDADW
jgi:hypothetical protein